MIQFEDPKLGKVVIYDESDVVTTSNYSDEIVKRAMRGGHRQLSFISNVIGFRNRKKGIAKLLKNRHGSTNDEKMKEFIFNYGVEEEVFDPIFSRFDILDL